MSIKITSPLEGFTGTSVFGSETLEFRDGVAEVENLSAGVRTYLKSRDYKVGRQTTPATKDDAAASGSTKAETTPADPDGSDDAKGEGDAAKAAPAEDSKGGGKK